MGSLGDRMQGYEKQPQQKLMTRVPVVIRLDGKAFHTYTKGFDKPFDWDLHKVRSATLKYLCENIQGCLFGYSQSDEISLVLKDWDTYKTSSWFDNKIQKLCSVTASLCTAAFNDYGRQVEDERTRGRSKFTHKTAIFDARCFNLPKEEVLNYLIWRQQDWERNSVQMIAQSLYSHKDLQKLSCKNLIAKIEREQGIIWGQLPAWQKRGEVWLRGKGILETPQFKQHREMFEEALYKENN